jgi:hypothetical protein
VLNLADGANLDPKIHSSKLSFFGVFDGHGGSTVALFAGENIHKIIVKQDTFKAGDYAQGLKDGFLATDRAILNGMQQETNHSLIRKQSLKLFYFLNDFCRVIAPCFQHSKILSRGSAQPCITNTNISCDDRSQV